MLSLISKLSVDVFPTQRYSQSAYFWIALYYANFNLYLHINRSSAYYFYYIFFNSKNRLKILFFCISGDDSPLIYFLFVFGHINWVSKLHSETYQLFASDKRYNNMSRKKLQMLV